MKLKEIDDLLVGLSSDRKDVSVQELATYLLEYKKIALQHANSDISNKPKYVALVESIDLTLELLNKF